MEKELILRIFIMLVSLPILFLVTLFLFSLVWYTAEFFTWLYELLKDRFGR